MSPALKEINSIGLQVAGKLARLKEGKNIRLEDLDGLAGLSGDWGKREKEKQLREWLERVNLARDRVLNDTHHLCMACETEIESHVREANILETQCIGCKQEKGNE